MEKSKLVIPVIISLAMIVLASFVYFNSNKTQPENNSLKYYPLFKSITAKASYTETGELKLFAAENSDELKKISAALGVNTPSQDSMVLGKLESDMMLKEKLFSAPGDKLNDFFGLKTVTIAGTLKQTDTIIDDMHFFTESNYNQLTSNSYEVFIKLNQERMPKVFLKLQQGETPKFKLKLSEGNFDAYKPQIIDGKEFFPIILGAKEAKMMRDEKLFTSIGDTLQGFFTQNVVIIGVIEETNTSLDMMHITQLDSNSFKGY